MHEGTAQKNIVKIEGAAASRVKSVGIFLRKCIKYGVYVHGTFWCLTNI